MSRPTRLARSSSLVFLAGLAGLATLSLPGCYGGPIDLPDGEPWAHSSSDTSHGNDASDTEASGGSGPASASNGSGESSTGVEGETEATSGAGDSSSGDPEGPPPVDVPDIAYCDEVADWDPSWVQLELDILELVNQRRAEGANCGSEGNFGPAGPLAMQPALRCAARKHSKDMNDRSFFDHVNPSGESPWDRMAQAGYTYSAAGENIAGGSPDAAGTMNQWMNSDGHCSNIMNPSFEEIGVGYYPGGQWGTLWTQTFGAQ